MVGYAPRCCRVCRAWGEGAWRAVTQSRILFRMFRYVWKGANPFTEMYSGLKAEVLVPGDPTTNMNHGLVERLKLAARVVVGGEARGIARAECRVRERSKATACACTRAAARVLV